MLSSVSYSLIGQVSVELEDFVDPWDTNVQFYGSHGNPFLNMSFSWLVVNIGTAEEEGARDFDITVL